jgi:hypothetical protein
MRDGDGPSWLPDLKGAAAEARPLSRSRHFVYRKESLRTTWKLRLALVGGLALLVFLTRGSWIPGIVRSLTCAEHVRTADAILVENFDVDYLPFERAAALQQEGFSSKILVPVMAPTESSDSSVDEGIVEVMTRIARLKDWQTIRIREIEPISLNAASQIRTFLTRAQIRSVLIVAPSLRSRRSSMIYDAVLTPAGISVSCVPVAGLKTAETWIRTWHGIQDVTQQFVKLQYYRFWVLPLAARRLAAGG